jgi:tetratricopeptide (TPR) repeat protein
MALLKEWTNGLWELYDLNPYDGFSLKELYWQTHSMEYIENTLRAMPYDFALVRSIASTSYKRGQSELAIEFYEKAMELAPTNCTLYNGLAETYRDMGQTQDAIETLEKMMSECPVLSFLLPR